jgi:hypothetical protein
LGGTWLRDDITNTHFKQAYRDVLTSKVDDALGIHLVPDTFYRKDVPGLGSGSMMRWVQNADPQNYWRGDPLTDIDAYKFSVLDLIIGNTDRHGKNYMRNRTNGAASAIDNGLTFPNQNQDKYGLTALRSKPSRRIKGKPHDFDPMGETWRLSTASKIQHILDNFDSFLSRFSTMSSSEREAFRERLILVRDGLRDNTISRIIEKWETGW